jgi:ABC-type iron transport system FetAB permease component
MFRQHHNVQKDHSIVVGYLLRQKDLLDHWCLLLALLVEMLMVAVVVLISRLEKKLS